MEEGRGNKDAETTEEREKKEVGRDGNKASKVIGNALRKTNVED